MIARKTHLRLKSLKFEQFSKLSTEIQIQSKSKLIAPFWVWSLNVGRPLFDGS